MNRLQLSRRDDDFFRDLLNGTAPKLNRRSPHSHRLLARALDDVKTALVDPITNDEWLVRCGNSRTATHAKNFTTVAG
jgi:hypothetical protein